MKIQFVTVNQNSFDKNEGITRDMEYPPSLGDLIAFTPDERRKLNTVDTELLVVMERIIREDNSMCVTVDTEEVRQRLNYKNHLSNVI